MRSVTKILLPALLGLAAACGEEVAGPTESGADARVEVDAGVTPAVDASSSVDAAAPDACAESAPPGPPADPAPAQPSSGCGSAAPSTGETTITVGSESRAYRLNLPGGYDSSTPYPLILGFHGATSSAQAFESSYYGGLGPVAGDHAILVYPQALVRTIQSNTQVQWQISEPEDLAFFDALVARLSDELCVDQGRVFATGHSSGAYFTNRLGCERGDVLRAIAPLAGGGPITYFTGPCVGQVAVWLEHGDSDTVVSIPAGEGSRDLWRDENSCGTEVRWAYPCDCVSYQGCDPGYPVHWCVSSGGHEPRPGFTADGSWEFFRSL
jgi:hypothetical protein